ncbi:MAG: hypothetical protein H7837_06295 [Magnetococcus sp. MYC-9]
MAASLPDGMVGIVRGQLMRPRALSVRAGGAVCGLLGVEDPLDGLRREVLELREPFEVEWLLSPLFTPASQELEGCEPALPVAGLVASEVDALAVALVAESLSCPVSYGHREQEVPVMEVVIDRYVRLLHLDAAIHPLLLPVLEQWAAGADRFALFSLARRSVWQRESRARLLQVALQAMLSKESCRVDKVRFLTDFVGSYRPAGEQELVHALTNLVDAYHRDHEHPIYNQMLEHYQGGNIRSQSCGADVRAYRLSMAHALLVDFGYSPALHVVP